MDTPHPASARYKWFGVAVLLMVGLVIYQSLNHTLWQIKEASTCARCRALQWAYYPSMQSSNPTRTTFIENGCSKYVAEHESEPHIHEWCKSRDFWLLSVTGKTIGGGSRDASSIWFISSEEQLAIYRACDNHQTRKQAFQFFEQFATNPKSAQEQYMLLSRTQQLLKRQTITKEDLLIPADQNQSLP
jgi:hypothetical protein